MKFNPEIFKAYDIRGEYGKDFDKEFGYSLGAALVRYLNAKLLIVGRDARESSEELLEAVCKGITESGCNVVLTGITSSPLFYYALGADKNDGGIMVTASHLGDEFNGFKVFREDAVPVAGDTGLRVLRDGLKEVSLVVGMKGEIRHRERLLEDYTRFAIERSGISGTTNITVRIETNTVVKNEFLPACSALGIKVVDGDADVHIELDTDGDRLIFYDNTGNALGGDLIGGLLAGDLPTNSVMAHDLYFSRGVLGYLHQRNIRTVRSKVGHTFVPEVMKEHGAVVGGELSGHIFFQETHYIEATLLAFLKVIKIMKDKNVTKIDTLVQPMKGWFGSGIIKCPLKLGAFGDIRNALAAHFKDGKQDELDGIAVDYPDWWFAIRPSNTEPIAKLLVEAKTKALMDEKIKEVQALMAP